MGDTEKFGNNVPTTPSNSPEEEWDDIDDSLFFYEEFEPVEFSREEEEEDSNEPDYENGEFLTEEEKNSFSARKQRKLVKKRKKKFKKEKRREKRINNWRENYGKFDPWLNSHKKIIIPISVTLAVIIFIIGGVVEVKNNLSNTTTGVSGSVAASPTSEDSTEFSSSPLTPESTSASPSTGISESASPSMSVSSEPTVSITLTEEEKEAYLSVLNSTFDNYSQYYSEGEPNPVSDEDAVSLGLLVCERETVTPYLNNLDDRSSEETASFMVWAKQYAPESYKLASWVNDDGTTNVTGSTLPVEEVSFLSALTAASVQICPTE